MRTRILSKLTNHEVERYLETNDIIIVPVGTVEMHGALPLDCETVLSEAFALRMADEVNALVLPNLPYFYAGATASGRGTVQVSVRAGIDYLMEIARSLLRQGFKRQIYVSFHGPAHITCSPVMRDFFDATKVPILYLDFIMAMQNILRGDVTAMDPDELNNLFYAAYDILGRLDDVPLTTSEEFDFSRAHTQTVSDFDTVLSKLAYISGGYGYYFGDPMDHSPTPRIDTVEELRARAEKGTILLDRIVRELDVPRIANLMKDVETFTWENVVPHYGEWLP